MVTVVFGARGNVGRHVAAGLRAAGEQVRVTSRNPATARFPSQLQVAAADLEEPGTLPAALAGITWFLFLTGTRLSVPALTGAIMCMGVATSNSILVVTFAREQLEVLVGDAHKAALNAGFVRFRPVLMTALAMIIGMVPMALGLGDGGEQNAPLGRAVIGGLLLATAATLFFVPAFFSIVHGWLESRKSAHQPVAALAGDEFDE